MAATIFHWGLHPWAIYAIVALALAFFSLQQGAAADHALGVLSDLRRAGLGLARPRHRHPGGVRDAVRPGHLARLRRRAGERRPELPLRHAGHRGHQGDADHLHHRGRPALGRRRPRCGREAPVGDQHGAGRAAAASSSSSSDRPLAILTGFFHNLLAYAENLPALSNPFGRSDDNFRARLDCLLLGLVDLLVAVRRHVHRPGQPRPHGARVHRLRAAHPVPGLRALDDGIRRHRHQPDRQRRLSGRSWMHRWN